MGAMYHHVRRDICGEDGEMLIPMVVIWLRLFGANRDAEPIAEVGEIARKTNQATHICVFTRLPTEYNLSFFLDLFFEMFVLALKQF